MKVSRRIGPLVVAAAAMSCESEVTVDLLKPGVTQQAVPTSSQQPVDAPTFPVDAAAPGPAETSTVPEPPAPDPSPGSDAGSPTPVPEPENSLTIDSGMGPPVPKDAGPMSPTDILGSLQPIHHYDFEGTGTIVYDRVGEAHGQLLGGATLDGMGGVLLDGEDDYVELPAGLISALPAATFVAWLEWSGGDCWQRIFDFGSLFVDEVEGITYATSSVFLTPSTCAWAHFDRVQEAVVAAEFQVDDTVYFSSGDPFPSDTPTFAALVVDPVRGLEVFVDGAIVGRAAAPLDLAQIEDVNAWLGRSLWSVDAMLFGRYDEFLIFDTALTAGELAALYTETEPAQPE